MKLSTPSTANPSMRKGSNSSQISGYNIRSKRASGQHNTSNMNQSNIFISYSSFNDFAGSALAAI